MKRELIGGIHAIEALIEHAPERIIRLWAKPGAGRVDEVVAAARGSGIAVESCDEAALDRRLPDVVHQGLVAEFTPKPPWDEHALVEQVSQADAPLVVMLDGVQDPHNLGAILRSAAACGALAVVTTKDRASGLTPAARKASAGASEWLPTAVVTNLSRTLETLKKAGLWSIGLEMSAGESMFSEAVDDWLAGPVVLVVGSEGQGLRKLTAQHCDRLVHIPMPGAMESLNVSVAAAVALFSVVRARGRVNP